MLKKFKKTTPKRKAALLRKAKEIEKLFGKKKAKTNDNPFSSIHYSPFYEGIISRPLGLNSSAEVDTSEEF